jgi:hypothetical protein
MIADILTVVCKEGRGLLRHQGSRTKAMLSLLIPMAMPGIYLPLQIGRALVEGPWSLLAAGPLQTSTVDSGLRAASRIR